jgi:hypothetical protein
VSKFLKDYKPEPKTPGSGDIIEEFLNSGKEAAIVDVDRLGKTVVGVYSGLRSYIDRHNMPCRVRQEEGNLILERVERASTDEQTDNIDQEEQ